MENPSEMIPSNAPTSPLPAPSHVDAPSGEARETEKGPHEKLCRLSGTRVCSAQPYPSASSICVTRSQVKTISAKTSVAKNPIAAPRHRAPDGTHHSHTSHSPPTNHSGDATESTTRNWEYTAAHRQHSPTPTPHLTGDRNRNRTEEPGANTAFPTDPTEKTGNVRH